MGENSHPLGKKNLHLLKTGQAGHRAHAKRGMANRISQRKAGVGMVVDRCLAIEQRIEIGGGIRRGRGLHCSPGPSDSGCRSGTRPVAVLAMTTLALDFDRPTVDHRNDDMVALIATVAAVGRRIPADAKRAAHKIPPKQAAQAQLGAVPVESTAPSCAKAIVNATELHCRPCVRRSWLP